MLYHTLVLKNDFNQADAIHVVCPMFGCGLDMLY